MNVARTLEHIRECIALCDRKHTPEQVAAAQRHIDSLTQPTNPQKELPLRAA